MKTRAAVGVCRGKLNRSFNAPISIFSSSHVNIGFIIKLHIKTRKTTQTYIKLCGADAGSLGFLGGSLGSLAGVPGVPGAIIAVV